MKPIIALFYFTIRRALFSRKIILTLLLLATPCVLVLVIRHFEAPFRNARPLWELYNVLAHFYLGTLLVPLVCMVHGAALIGPDIEARTIVYLTMRQPRRATVLLVKYLAIGVVLVALCSLAMMGVHVCALTGHDVPALVAGSGYADWDPARDLRSYLTVMPMEVFSYLAVFCLIGLLTKRPLAVSAVYLVIIELILSNIPARVALCSVAFHLRRGLVSMTPRLLDLYELPVRLRDQLYPADAPALAVVLGIILAALAFASALVTYSELVPARVSRE